MGSGGTDPRILDFGTVYKPGRFSSQGKYRNVMDKNGNCQENRILHGSISPELKCCFKSKMNFVPKC
jgi:hypothetical protein